MPTKAINQTVKTSGDGCWSNRKADVIVSKIEWQTHSYDEDIGGGTETDVFIYFSPKSWNVNKHGLIYTDKSFIKSLKELLVSLAKNGDLPQDLPWEDIGYSEQGMQGRNYVHTVLGGW